MSEEEMQATLVELQRKVLAIGGGDETAEPATASPVTSGTGKATRETPPAPDHSQ